MARSNNNAVSMLSLPEVDAGRHSVAIGQALLVVFLWATFFILIKYGLQSIPPVTFAGLRYLLAALMLLAYGLLVDRRFLSLPWKTVIIIGVLQYGVAQALQNEALSVLPTATVALLFSLLPITSAVIGKIWLDEGPSSMQVGGAALTIVGVALYLSRSGLFVWRGSLLAFAAVLAISVAVILTRGIARERRASTLHLTMVSMGAGAFAILPVGLVFEPPASFPIPILVSLIWLSLGTAIAFSLWNHALRTLTAFEVNVIGNSLVFQVGILGWIFLGERFTLPQVAGVVVTIGGILLVQMEKGDSGEKQPSLR